ncbi:hypothetical protein L484_021657 [Morus notabilis]|uniref:Uncharacterized protein n=1 Tax=Morus notabilis TaxID=981085 RepID=W9SEP1_9ROSA|nr:hypothetical protein L484_021657 [Morus notabilis]
MTKFEHYLRIKQSPSSLPQDRPRKEIGFSVVRRLAFSVSRRRWLIDVVWNDISITWSFDGISPPKEATICSQGRGDNGIAFNLLQGQGDDEIAIYVDYKS